MVRDIYSILARPSHTSFIAAYSLSPSSFSDTPEPPLDTAGLPASSGKHANTGLPFRSLGNSTLRIMSAEATVGIPAQKRQHIEEVKNKQPVIQGHGNLSSEMVDLNNKRRAFGAKGYEAFVQRHSQPKKKPKPSFLTAATPSIQELQECIPYIFRATPDGKQQVQELRSEIECWTQGFSLLNHGVMSNAETDEQLLSLLTALNEAVEKCTGRTRQLFYETSRPAGFETALDQAQAMTKSVRVMKEIEEFQDVKEEWKDPNHG